ncbi:MAG: hypothetical protein IT379_29645 [Deltaproteobacteria bacterium]|nr:hypothetical protein [Deltaproteobacteria bacterium]
MIARTDRARAARSLVLACAAGGLGAGCGLLTGFGDLVFVEAPPDGGVGHDGSTTTPPPLDGGDDGDAAGVGDVGVVDASRDDAHGDGGDACSRGDACASIPPTCTDACGDDELPCTSHRCIEGVCIVSVTSGCALDGMCWSAGDRNPRNPCLRCDPVVSATSWTARVGCADEQTCAFDGDCVDMHGCTLDSCGADGLCAHRPTEGFCVLDGACYRNGDVNPTNPCEACDPAKPDEWSSRDGASCGADAVCCGGVCAPSAEASCSCTGCPGGGTCCRGVLCCAPGDSCCADGLGAAACCPAGT